MGLPSRFAVSSVSTAVALIGLAFQLANLEGCFRNDSRQRFLAWALESKVGLPMDDPAAAEFASRFPPPAHNGGQRATHITKTTLATSDGAIMSAQFNYMYSDQSRSPHVASLEDMRTWAAETPYQWWAWYVTLLGVLGMACSSILDWQDRSKHPNQDRGSGVVQRDA